MTGMEISRHRRRRMARRIRQTVALRRLARDRFVALDSTPPPTRAVAAPATYGSTRRDRDAGPATDTAQGWRRLDRPVPVRRSPTLAWASIAATAPE